tara:strand:+ start:310 stop:582 length:273 start_codon:yes stop_codon:yes gene_type:complete
MCVGNLFKPPKPPAAPPRMRPAPPIKSAAPPAEVATPEKIKDETGDDELVDTRKRKALEVQKTQEGVGQLGAIKPKALPKTPAGGIAAPE